MAADKVSVTIDIDNVLLANWGISQTSVVVDSVEYCDDFEEVIVNQTTG